MDLTNLIPRVAALHDLSGFGRCSLSVILPVMSRFGIQVCPVPTAVLSTHTGGFTDFTFVDLTDSMRDTLNHYQSLHIQFDSIYSGFLGSLEQIDIVKDYIDSYRKNAKIILVDPVFADDGELYATFDLAMVNRMRELIGKADIITPNLTEAAFLLEEPVPDLISGDKAENWATRLTEMGPGICVITGVRFEEGMVSSLAYDKVGQRCFLSTQEEVRQAYPGTGDLFASIFLSCMLKKDDLESALHHATGFVYRAIRMAYEQNLTPREGLPIEAILAE